MELIDKIMEAGNLTKACREVVKNKGAGGVDKMPVQTRKTNPMSFDERIEKLNSTIRGWMEYFKYASIQQKLLKLDGWLRIGAKRKSRTP